MIGIIAATVTLGTAMFASVRSIRHELRQEVREARGELREEMTTGFKEINTRLVSVGDRLSKVEGVIEGMFWGARSQPSDKPREGAA